MTDKEYLDLLSTVAIQTEILLGILRYTSVKSSSDINAYHAELKKKLKFENDNDHILLRCCIDILEDTQYAVDEVYENGLITKPEHQGEMYLRLYGVLNAVYLQMGALIDLMRLFNLKDQKSKRQFLKSSKIIDFRNKAASHTTNYIKPGTKEVDFFKLTQSTINKWGNSLVAVGADSIHEIDLIPSLKEFTGRIEMILLEVIEKELSARTFKLEHREWLEFRQNYLRRERLFKTEN